MRAARQLRIEAHEAIPFHVDGEPRLGGRTLNVETVPAALTVRVATV
jgi:diacylglycerol kinase family enzyme